MFDPQKFTETFNSLERNYNKLKTALFDDEDLLKNASEENMRKLWELVQEMEGYQCDVGAIMDKLSDIYLDMEKEVDRLRKEEQDCPHCGSPFYWWEGEERFDYNHTHCGNEAA